MSELRTIPNVGACTEQDLILMGYPTIASLRGKSAEELYAGECRLRGCTLDRCQLYLYRAVEYFVNTEHPDPMKCNGGSGKMTLSSLLPAVQFVWSVLLSRWSAEDAGK